METISKELPSSVTISVKYHGEQTIDLADMSPEWLAWAIGNGVRQSVADADAGKANTPEGEAAVKEKLERIAAGNIPQGGGGGGNRLSPYQKALKDIIVDLLNGAGLKKADATKRAKDPEIAFKDYLTIALTAKYGEAGVNERLDEAFSTNYPKIEAKALKLAEERQATADVAI